MREKEEKQEFRGDVVNLKNPNAQALSLIEG